MYAQRGESVKAREVVNVIETLGMKVPFRSWNYVLAAVVAKRTKSEEDRAYAVKVISNMSTVNSFTSIIMKRFEPPIERHECGH
jgi:hypothetical protein